MPRKFHSAEEFQEMMNPKRSRYATGGRSTRAKARSSRRDPGEMNGTERAYSLLLNHRIATGEVVSWRYEAITFRLAKRTTITPDFWVVMADGSIEIHEVKACKANGSYLIEDDANVKIKIAAKEYQEFTWFLCGKLPKKAGDGWRIEEIPS